MANTALIVPAEQVNPKTGARQFDFDQLKIFLTNIVSEVGTANGTANSTNASVTAAYNQANLATALAVTAQETADAAYAEANVAAANAATANATAFYAVEIAEDALASIVSSNGAANTVAVYWDGNLIIAAANVNFNDTATVNGNVYISATANQIQANIEFSTNGTAVVGPTATIANLALAVAQSAYDTANAAGNTGIATYANGTLVLSDSDVNWNNTATMNVSVTANGANQTNIAWSVNGTAIVGTTAAQANLAYLTAINAANTVAVYESGNLILSQADINFNNSATVNANVSANGTQANLQFEMNTSAIVSGGVLAITAANASNIVIGGNATNVTIDTALTGGGGGGGSPGGSNGQIQFNNNGAFGGDANLAYNVASGVLTVNAEAIFTGNVPVSAPVGITVGYQNNTYPIIYYKAGGAPANNGAWQQYAAPANSWYLTTLNDAGTAGNVALQVVRANTAVANINYGNSSDNPYHTFNGPLYLSYDPAFAGSYLQLNGAGGGFGSIYQYSDGNMYITANSATAGFVFRSSTNIDWFTLTSSLATAGVPLYFSIGTGAIVSSNVNTYGTLTIQGSNGGYAGFQFTSISGYNTLMWSSGVQGSYEVGTGWQWYIDGGLLYQITGASGAWSATSFNATSDANKKHNIRRITDAQHIIASINGVRFNWNEDGRASAGLIAQDVEKVMPELITTEHRKSEVAGTEEEFKVLNYNGIIGVLVEEVKALREEIERLKKLVK